MALIGELISLIDETVTPTGFIPSIFIGDKVPVYILSELRIKNSQPQAITRPATSLTLDPRSQSSESIWESKTPSRHTVCADPSLLLAPISLARPVPHPPSDSC